jgi:uncharacterized coiled-coil DUF342 family protein
MSEYRPPSYKEMRLSSPVLDFLIEYTKEFLCRSKAELDRYRALLREYQEHVPELNPQEDRYMKELHESIGQAEQLVYEVEQLKKEVYAKG